MAGFATTSANEVLDLLLRATTMADFAENDTTSPATNLYVALHTADPAAGTQATSEAAYTSYARVAVARSTGFAAASSAATSNAGTITFPTCTGSSSTCTHFSIGKGSSGATQILLSGALTSTVVISVGNPVATFAAGDLDITLD